MSDNMRDGNTLEIAGVGLKGAIPSKGAVINNDHVEWSEQLKAFTPKKSVGVLWQSILTGKTYKTKPDKDDVGSPSLRRVVHGEIIDVHDASDSEHFTKKVEDCWNYITDSRTGQKESHKLELVEKLTVAIGANEIRKELVCKTCGEVYGPNATYQVLLPNKFHTDAKVLNYKSVPIKKAVELGFLTKGDAEMRFYDDTEVLVAQIALERREKGE